MLLVGPLDGTLDRWYGVAGGDGLVVQEERHLGIGLHDQPGVGEACHQDAGELGHVVVHHDRIESGDGVSEWRTVGGSTDIIEASWRALADSLEYWLLKQKGK